MGLRIWVLLVPLLGKVVRPRLSDAEVALIVDGLLMKLKALYEERVNLEVAKVTYGLLKKMMYNRAGRPDKEEFSWDAIVSFLNLYIGTDET